MPPVTGSRLGGVCLTTGFAPFVHSWLTAASGGDVALGGIAWPTWRCCGPSPGGFGRVASDRTVWRTISLLSGDADRVLLGGQDEVVEAGAWSGCALALGCCCSRNPCTARRGAGASSTGF